ncbi:kell blood group glycoprotein isoform X2 [Corythoichthys intestinalis]|uniref:kell blood group glycoprotein isoform X2 n=1 Tax=Corythoichthys intestinalis TaxID=161448 RepID=UPI0025A67171|nr:kell blood group glycoprotein isoform X2 [Corythoichthys intestinalis]
MDYTIRETQQDFQMLRMSGTSTGLEPGRENGLQPRALFQLNRPTEDQIEVQPQVELELHRHRQQEYQQHAEQRKPAWLKPKCTLSVFIACFCLSAVFLGMVYYIRQSLHRVSPCDSPACQKASVHLSMSSDPFTHPCDYFLFTCGPERADDQGKSRRGVKENRTLDRKTELLQYLREILESNDELASSSVKKAKEFYRTCMDTKSLAITGVEPFLALVHKLGGWSLFGQWSKTDFNSTLSMLMRDYATFPFFNVYVGEDPTDASSKRSKRYIQIDQPDLIVPIKWNREMAKSEVMRETVGLFLDSCKSHLMLLGAPPDEVILHVGPFISLSSNLAVTMAPLSYRRAKGQLYRKLTIKELQRRAPAINWLACLQAVFHPEPLTEDEHILLHNLPYVVQMSHIITNKTAGNELKNSELHTFMVLNLLHTLLPALDSRFSNMANTLSVAFGHTRLRQRDLQTKTDAPTELFTVAPRWKRCVMETELGFGDVLAPLLRENVATGEAEELIENILSSFKSHLRELKWSDQKALQIVMNKVESVTPRIVTTKENQAELDLLYSEKRLSRLLREDNDNADILAVSPSLLGNELVIPAGIFIPPFFHPTYPRAMNYGVLGFLLAKDLLHQLLPDIYSQSEMVRAIGQCVWSHYRTVTDKDIGEVSLSAAQQQEVSVQYLALQIALKAYEKSLKKQPADTSISEFSHTHLFFIAFSQANCDADQYHHLMPMEPSFIMTVVCAKSRLCPTNLQCLKTTRRYSWNGC